MKKRITVLGIVTVLLSIFGLVGCSGEHKVYEDGYFQYIVVGENSRFPNKENKAIVAIVGFTDLGKEQEVIDFPTTIDGKEVKYIGYGPKTAIFGSGNYRLESDNLSKVYIHENIEFVYKWTFSEWTADDAELNIMICAAKEKILGLSGTGIRGCTYIYREFYEMLRNQYEVSKQENPHLDLVPFENNGISPANIEFLNNYSTEVNGGYYRLDNIASGEKIPLPPPPARDGYEFAGWFAESACINAWNFDTGTGRPGSGRSRRP